MSLTFEKAIKEVDWEKLEKQHRILIAGNTASVFVRRWLFPDKLLFTAVAFLGTTAIDLKMQTQSGVSAFLELDARERVTELNVEAELKAICMIALGEWSAAQKMVEAE